MTQLNTQSLAIAAQRGTAMPAYDRQSLTPSVVHIGLGAFHRAHQAMVFDALLSKGDRRWGVLGVAMRSTQLADTLKAQGRPIRSADCQRQRHPLADPRCDGGHLRAGT